MTATVAPSTYQRLNVGSGPKPAGTPTFLYVDRRAWPVDVTADLVHLPFRDGAFEHVHCAHLIEHIAKGDVPAALAEIRRVLSATGVVYVAAPDIDRAKAAKSKQWVFYTLRGGVPEGWEHRWVCSARRLRKMLKRAGLTPSWTTGVPAGWPPNTHSWPVDFEARFVCRRDDFPWPDKFPAGIVVIP